MKIDQKSYFEKKDFKLYLEDSLKLLEKLPQESIDMVFADPPYNLSNGGISVHAGRMVSVNKGDWDKSKGFKDDYGFHFNWLKACKRVLKPNGTLWVSGTYHSIYQCGYAIQSLGYHILNDISWFKPNAAPNLSCNYFTASHETLIWARKDKKAKHLFNYKDMVNWNKNYKKEIKCKHCGEIERYEIIHEKGKQMRSVWVINPPQPEEKKYGKHPTQKPLALLERIIIASTNKGDLILDPFTGSSTTGLAAVKLGRKFIGIDTEKNYLDLSIKRFNDI